MVTFVVAVEQALSPGGNTDGIVANRGVADSMSASGFISQAGRSSRRRCNCNPQSVCNIYLSAGDFSSKGSGCPKTVALPEDIDSSILILNR
jgi:hypothetical protein